MSAILFKTKKHRLDIFILKRLSFYKEGEESDLFQMAICEYIDSFLFAKFQNKLKGEYLYEKSFNNDVFACYVGSPCLCFREHGKE